MHLFSNYHVTGHQNIPKAPYLVTINHQSYWDAPAIGSLTPNQDLADAGDEPKQDLEAFRQFLEERANAPSQIRDALLQGDLTAAQRMVRAVKIAAGSTFSNRLDSSILFSLVSSEKP